MTKPLPVKTWLAAYLPVEEEQKPKKDEFFKVFREEMTKKKEAVINAINRYLMESSVTGYADGVFTGESNLAYSFQMQDQMKSLLINTLERLGPNNGLLLEGNNVITETCGSLFAETLDEILSEFVLEGWDVTTVSDPGNLLLTWHFALIRE